MKNASLETVLNRELAALNKMTLSENPKDVLAAAKAIKDLAQTFKIGGHETNLRKSVKVVLLKYCSEVIRLPRKEREGE